MFQTCEEVMSWINGQLNQGIKPGLERMEWMMEKLNHPERTVRAVHIGGTNGKGSTVTFLRSILQAADYEIGTFTSPYIESFQERISINGKPIPDADLVKAANTIKPIADELGQTALGYPTEFELLSAIAIYYFGTLHKVDLTLIEVGLGGRNDATNIIHPFVSVITNIGYDHMNILGNTLTDIAKEKAGIIKSGSPVITGVQNPELLTIFEEIAKEKRTTVYKLGQQFSYEDLGSSTAGEQFSVKTLFQTYRDLSISMFGKHQIENATLAIMTAEYLRQFYAFYIEPEHIQEGVKNAFWPGRFEVRGNIILDGAHNREGIETLIDTLKRHNSDKKIHVLFTALKDKPLAKMINLLDEQDYDLYFTEFEHSRATKAENLYDLSNASHKEIILDWAQFIKDKVKQLQDNELLVICGSLYFIKEVKKALCQ